VKVCDHGKGIDEEEILHIFDRYYMGRTNFDIPATRARALVSILLKTSSLSMGVTFLHETEKMAVAVSPCRFP